MKCQINFKLGIVGSISIHEKSSYLRALKSYNFAWNISIFQPSSFIVVTKSFSFYLMRRIIPKKSFCIFLSSLTICFRKVVINAWKTIFYISIVLKITIFSSSVGFLIFHILKLVAYLLEFYKDFSLLLIFCYKRNGYLIFLMYQYSDLYNAYHRLPLEPL